MKRDIGIDVIKFFAAFLITNSHMEALYPQNMTFFATGGAIGDALFFFCSGFTLFLKPMGRFDSWYKKRINRIYPTVFVRAILFALLFNIHNDVNHTIIHGGGWFVSCIMIYYVVAYIIDKFMSNHLHLSFGIASIISIIAYFIWDKPENYTMYGHTYLKWVFFFLFMLFGAIVGKKPRTISGRKSLLFLFLCVITYYAIVIPSQRYDNINDLQLLSLVPLLGITYFTYSLFNCSNARQLFNKKFVNTIVMFIGGLCLEIYLIQNPLLKINLGIPYPVNYIVMFIMIIVGAYILRCCARIFSQTFSKEDYDWTKVFQAI